MFFESWYGLFRVAFVGLLAYGALIVILRVSGKRTLAKWNMFDFVVTIALGSTLASVLLSKDVALLEGVMAFVILIGLQFIITKLSVKFQGVADLVKSQPTLLLHHGKILHDAVTRTRVTESEIKAAVRAAGAASFSDIEAVVLETDGSFSVIKEAGPQKDALSDVMNYEVSDRGPFVITGASAHRSHIGNPTEPD